MKGILFLGFFTLIFAISVNGQDQNALQPMELSEIDKISLSTREYITNIKLSVRHLIQKIQQLARVVQTNADRYLERFADSLRNVFRNAHEGSDPGAIDFRDNGKIVTSTSIAPVNGKKMNAAAIYIRNVLVNLAHAINSLKLRLHNKIEKIIQGVDRAVFKFDSVVNGSMDDFQVKVDLLKRSYPAIQTEECSEMLRNFKLGVKVVFESSLNCLIREIRLRSVAVDDVDDMALEDIKMYSQRLSEAWKCAKEKEGNYFVKFVHCVNFESVKSAWDTVKNILHFMDSDFTQYATEIEQSVSMFNCISKKTRNSFESEIIKLVQSVAKCSTAN